MNPGNSTGIAERSGRDIKIIKALGRRALALTRKMADKKQITPEFDPRDKYGRISVYVYLMDGTFLNAEIIELGHRFACTRFPFKSMEDFRRYEKETRENKRGGVRRRRLSQSHWACERLCWTNLPK